MLTIKFIKLSYSKEAFILRHALWALLCGVVFFLSTELFARLCSAVFLTVNEAVYLVFVFGRLRIFLDEAERFLTSPFFIIKITAFSDLCRTCLPLFVFPSFDVFVLPRTLV